AFFTVNTLSNTTINCAGFFSGNSSVNALVNSSFITIGNSSVNAQINSTVISLSGTKLNADVPINALEFIFNGGGSPLTANTYGWLQCPYPATIQSVTLLADVSGNCVFDIYKCTYANYNPGTHPVYSDSITSSDKPTLLNTYKNTDSTLTGWTTTISTGDVLAFVVNTAATNATLVTLILKLLKT